MKAAWYERTGEAIQVLEVGVIDDPAPKKGEVLVSLKTSGLNPSDVKTRAGARGDLSYSRIIPHSDGGGIVIDVGQGVDRERIGERVWLWNAAYKRNSGTCAELVSLPESQAVSMNEQVSFESAACMGIPASTAYYGIFSNGPIKGKTILVSGGAGAVGFYGIQLAKWSGANVITTVSSEEKGEIAKDAGADIVINYKNQDVIDIVMENTNSKGVDRILEVEFGGNLSINEKIIKTNGVIAAYGSAAVMEPTLPFYNLMFKGVKIDTFLIYEVSNEDRKKIIKGLTQALNENALKHLIAQKFSMDDIVDAHESMESGSVIGNIVIEI